MWRGGVEEAESSLGSPPGTILPTIPGCPLWDNVKPFVPSLSNNNPQSICHLFVTCPDHFHFWSCWSLWYDAPNLPSLTGKFPVILQGQLRDNCPLYLWSLSLCPGGMNPSPSLCSHSTCTDLFSCFRHSVLWPSAYVLHFSSIWLKIGTMFHSLLNLCG